jgi:hypothetical protein
MHSASQAGERILWEPGGGTRWWQWHLFFSLLFMGVLFRLIYRLSIRLLVYMCFPISANTFNEVLEPPTLEQLRILSCLTTGWGASTCSHQISAFSPSQHLLTKIVQHNLWPTVRRSELILNRAQFFYAIVMRMPFCLCKQIFNRMLEMRDDHSIGLPFTCLVMKIILQYEIDVSVELKMKVQDPLGNQTLMKSNAQLRHEGQDEAP